MGSFKDIIDAFGAASLATLLAIEESHVRAMKARDSIPPEYWGHIVDAAALRGISGVKHDDLRRLRRARFHPHKTEAAE